MTNTFQIPVEQTYSKKIIIEAPVDLVWKYLTDLDCMLQWMSDEPLEIITDWHLGNAFTIKTTGHWVYSESNGFVIQYEENHCLAYSHLSSLSRLDYHNLKNYSEIMFRLQTQQNGTELVLTLNNFPTDAIYHHLVFYWKITLEVLKRHIEQQIK